MSPRTVSPARGVISSSASGIAVSICYVGTCRKGRRRHQIAHALAVFILDDKRHLTGFIEGETDGDGRVCTVGCDR
ncbi:MAG: hypothetical protein M3347_12800 [Armatimonadota bacterium]|nr:hypothetical protein [Armatimonadota bacterium]